MYFECSYKISQKQNQCFYEETKILTKILLHLKDLQLIQKLHLIQNKVMNLQFTSYLQNAILMLFIFR